MKKNMILVTGGAGYIGSHTAHALVDKGYNIVILDNLSNGNPDFMPGDAVFIKGDAGDQQLVSGILREYRVEAAIHFAGSIVVEESVADPLKYYMNNTMVSRNFIESCVNCEMNSLIFSSTAAVYGIPKNNPVTESSPAIPINPYGHSKIMIEQILSDVSYSSDLKYMALRYFNVSGADPLMRTGQVTINATHLIKVACELANGKREGMAIFGEDYNTPDGTCVRDFIHVSDLADIHVRAVEHLVNHRQSEIINCGYGKGFSVREVLDVIQKLADKQLNIKSEGRRPGDPPMLVADNGKLLSMFDWQPRFNDLHQILGHALEWERKLQAQA